METKKDIIIEIASKLVDKHAIDRTNFHNTPAAAAYAATIIEECLAGFELVRKEGIVPEEKDL